MKRHKSLMGLSHDHHHGLILAQLIKKNAPEYKGLATDLQEKIRYTKEAWNNELKLHFANEENILFPFVRGRNSELDILIDEIINEHMKIKNLINELDEKNNQQDVLDELGKTLEGHIRKEERKLFHLIQTLFMDELNQLDGKIIAVKDSCKI